MFYSIIIKILMNIIFSEYVWKWKYCLVLVYCYLVVNI